MDMLICVLVQNYEGEGVGEAQAPVHQTRLGAAQASVVQTRSGGAQAPMV